MFKDHRCWKRGAVRHFHWYFQNRKQFDLTQSLCFQEQRVLLMREAKEGRRRVMERRQNRSELMGLTQNSADVWKSVPPSLSAPLSCICHSSVSRSSWNFYSCFALELTSEKSAWQQWKQLINADLYCSQPPEDDPYTLVLLLDQRVCHLKYTVV